MTFLPPPPNLGRIEPLGDRTAQKSWVVTMVGIIKRMVQKAGIGPTEADAEDCEGQTISCMEMDC